MTTATCVDFDFHRLLFPAPKSTASQQVTSRDAKESNNSNITAITMTSATSRVPLLPRNPNHASGTTATTHSCSGDEGLSNSSKEGSSRSSCTAAGLNPLSVVESSNNENNKRILPSLASSMKSIFGQQQDSSVHNLPETSTITHTGAANSRDVVGPGHKVHAVKLTRGRSTERKVERQATAVSTSRSSSAPRSGIDVSSTKRAPAVTSSGSGREDCSDESVIFEERRNRVDGDGYTTHQYLRGRLLGKGGFAKVYFCTALDTNKHYAVKVVPKANLVKARSRQKVRSGTCRPL